MTLKRTLKPAELHLLVALVEGPLHGYALARRMREESDGQVRMMPGNLYAVIRRLVDASLVRETDAPPTADRDDQRRRYFALTTDGRALLRAEARRMARLAASIARRLPEPGLGDGGAAS